MDLSRPSRRSSSGAEDSSRSGRGTRRYSKDGPNNLKVTMENIITRIETDSAYKQGISAESMIPFLRSLYRVAMGSTNTLIELPLPLGCPPTLYTMIPEGCVVKSRGPLATNSIVWLTEHDLEVVTSDTRGQLVQSLTSVTLKEDIRQPSQNVPTVSQRRDLGTPSSAERRGIASWSGSVSGVSDVAGSGVSMGASSAVPRPLNVAIPPIPEGRASVISYPAFEPHPGFGDRVVNAEAGPTSPAMPPPRSDAGSDTVSVRSSASRMGFKTNAAIRGGGSISGKTPVARVTLTDD